MPGFNLTDFSPNSGKNTEPLKIPGLDSFLPKKGPKANYPMTGSPSNSSSNQSTGTTSSSTESPNSQSLVQSANQTQNDPADIKKSNSALAYTVGRNFPIIQINDMQFISSDIDYCEIEVKDMLPTLTLKCNFSKTQFLKMNMPKDGDVASVFMRPMNDFYKALHCDFVIKKVVTTPYKVRLKEGYMVVMQGDLFIPNFRKRGAQIAYPDMTSVEVLQTIAERFNIGYVINDPEPMNDKMIWYQAGESTYDFVKNVTEHAWKDDKSFYDSWIDQFYMLTFANQNIALGTTKDEDGILDIANNVVVTSRSIHDKLLDTDPKTGKSLMQEDNPKEVPRIFTNLTSAQYSNEFVEAYSVDNRSTEISEKYGHVIDLTYNINNQALFNSGSGTVQHLVIEPAYNMDKIFDHVLLRGRSRDGYNNKNTMQDFVNYNQETIINYAWGGNIQTMSDGDNTNTAVGNSGNSYKEYVKSYYHNLLNNKELEKITLNLELKGLNTAILKGEKVAVLNIEYDEAGALLNSPNKKISDDKEFGIIDMFYSGWFIVTGIKFIYDKSIKYSGLDVQQDGLNYKTIVSVSRREWVPPESVSPIVFDKDGNMIRKPLGSTKYDPLPAKTYTASSGGSGGTYSGSTPSNTSDKIDPSPARSNNIEPTKGSKNLKGNSKSRGLRNNNPLNIVKTKINWEGEDPNGNDSKFEVFKDFHSGARAAVKNIVNKVDNNKVITIKDLIYTWAPASDGNNPEQYTNFIAGKMGVTPNTRIDTKNRDFIAKLTYYMAIKENGQDAINSAGVTVEDFAKGYDMANIG